MLEFIRSDLSKLTAYTPHPGGEEGKTPESTVPLDHLDTNECPFDLPGELKEKLAWSYQQLIEANRYPDGGHGKLKNAIAEYVNESAALEKVVTANQISVGNGSDELIRSILIATCLGGEGSILIANPTFSMYSILAQTLGIPVVSVGRRQENFEMKIDDAQAAIEQTVTETSTQRPPIRVVFVVHPNSPTANPLTLQELEWLRGLPDKILVVIDEAYFEFSQASVVQELADHPNWVILRTFSKAFRLATHRVGYSIAHPELIAALEKIRLPYNLPSFSQAAAILALNHRQTLLASIPEIIAERDKLLKALSEHSALQVWPSASNFIYVRLAQSGNESTSKDLNQVTQAMKDQGTLIRHTGGGLRITVGSPEENTRTLQRLQAVLV
ncbi:histidinol-phosphate transaminase [Moorena sp. SIO4G3]|uniref:histidinol-phosphate transaminase n=1 Tax=Moorena sp. SIO4G3 TaxID=2607821 RepID=UPI00142D1812|nr:histidinol-phosphate transaminase [Moorena sp. SIO4G3]NEO75845.1 histidinol-phosphate transaminase [Moorena sp. SIO4G3]